MNYWNRFLTLLSNLACTIELWATAQIEKRLYGKYETIESPDFSTINEDNTYNPVRARMVLGDPPTRDYAGFSEPDPINKGTVMTKVLHSSGAYGPFDLYIVGASLIAHVHRLGWMVYGSSAPPSKDHPLYQIGEDGKPIWVTGTFIPPEAENWLNICKGKGYMYHDKSILTSVRSRNEVDKPS